MAIEDSIRQHMQNLIKTGEQLAVGDPAFPTHALDARHVSDCVGWLVSAEHIVSMVCTRPDVSYRRVTSALVQSEEASNYAAHDIVGKMTALLKQLLSDVENGLVASVVSAAQAEALDDLLDQAADYHSKRHKEGAGILATAVFEDAVRRLARAHDVPEAEVALDSVITALDQKDVITSIVAKRCRAAAGVRNHALHAQWGKVTLEDVDSVLRLTRELLSDRLAK